MVSRKDKKGRALFRGECQRKDGKYSWQSSRIKFLYNSKSGCIIEYEQR